MKRSTSVHGTFRTSRDVQLESVMRTKRTSATCRRRTLLKANIKPPRPKVAANLAAARCGLCA
jgi:hypothetical protein